MTAVLLVGRDADNAVLVTDYTEEPKYAAEVPRRQQGPAERDVAAAGAAAAPAGSEDSGGMVGSRGVPVGSGVPQSLAVGSGAGPAAVMDGQQVTGASRDARHLDAIFAPPTNGS
jgi:hypothetical protein